jgi:hypothetical protein
MKSSQNNQFDTFSAWKTCTKSISKTVMWTLCLSQINALRGVSLAILVSIHCQVMLGALGLMRVVTNRLALHWIQ